ncbi:LuxR C-terminal-related transcriptional regulator [Luteimicrobium sp. DT211]|uniref:LuxR C-terminal-related transcriptional regulator n=1 Tax=Luteimicrobium sp. DT211 TaxID=3393412 RepID=UPI003CF1AEE9
MVSPPGVGPGPTDRGATGAPKRVARRPGRPAGPDHRASALAILVGSVEPVVTVVAPPGYGKSALLSAWVKRRGLPVAWVACDQIDDDPRTLWRTVAALLGCPDPALRSGTPAPGDVIRVVDRLARALGARGAGTIVLDRVETVSGECLRSVVAFADAAPAGWRIALASRHRLPLPVARMRLAHRLVEIGTAELSLSAAEAQRLLADPALHLSERRAAELVRDAEGWPAALSLGALAVRSGEVTARRPFTGTTRLMGDYLRSEVLDALSDAERRFLDRTSIVDRVNGPLADSVVGGTGSARTIETLLGRNVMLPAAGEDDGEGWARCHPLVRQALSTELVSVSPELVPVLHRRAAQWLESHGEPERAVDHAYQAMDAEWFGRLVLEAMQPAWARGRIDLVLRWLGQLGSLSPETHTPALVAHGALVFALVGRPGDAERWAAVAESLAPPAAPSPDGTIEGALAYLRASLGSGGPASMRRDAADALHHLPPASPYRAEMIQTEGLADLLDGDLAAADAAFVHAYDVAVSVPAVPWAALALAEQFEVAVGQDDWTAAEALAKRSLEVVRRGPLQAYWTSALPFACAARAAARRGDMDEAREHAQRAAQLRPLLTYALPVVSVQVLLELARVYLALVDPAGASAVLEQARGILHQRPALGTLVTAARQLDERVGQITAARPVGASSLTAAELRLVPLLSTYLTYPEIGEQLFISRHTVKTHASSVYRKLGASSRREAVERIVELGLA